MSQENVEIVRKGYTAFAQGDLTAVVGLIAENIIIEGQITPDGQPAQGREGLLAALGTDGCPSVYACYRFATKLREHGHLLDACIAAVLTRLRDANPNLGENVAIDASDMPAYANGQRFVSKGGRERSDDEF